MRRSIVGLAAAIVLSVAGRADADLLTFDTIAPTEEHLTSPLSYDGFTFSSQRFHTFGYHYSMWPIAQNGTTHLSSDADRGGPITMTRDDGRAFSLMSIDVAEMFNNATQFAPNAELLSITAITASYGRVDYSLYLDGVNDGFIVKQGFGAADFQHFVLPLALQQDLIGVTFSGWLLDGSSGSVAIDNIEYSLSAAPVAQVPEPGTLALLGMGLLGLTAARRNRSRAGATAS